MKHFRFRTSVTKWFESHLSNGTFLVWIGNVFCDAGTLKYGVPKSYILGPLLFLLYVNSLLQLLSEDGFYLRADNICTFYQHEIVKKTENVLNKEFSSLWQWFIDKKLSIQFGEDKPKSIFFSKAKGLKEIDIYFLDHAIKQHGFVEFLGCQRDSKFRGEDMALKVLKNLNAKLKFLYQ